MDRTQSTQSKRVGKLTGGQAFAPDWPFEDAVGKGILSGLHILDQPEEFPFHVAICAVALPGGCSPPSGPVPRRIGCGTGPTLRNAALKAFVEGAERYALQFREGIDETLNPTIAVGIAADPVRRTDLSIGRPYGVKLTTKGAAAGQSMKDATERALFESFEHLVQNSDEPMAPVDPATLGSIDSHMSFLRNQFRTLYIDVSIPSIGVAVVRAVITDPNGARPTLGSAAAPSCEAAALRATEEAMLSWRNMIELERNAATAIGTTGEAGRLLRLYRGAESMHKPPMKTRPGQNTPDVGMLEMPLANALARFAQRPVRVFDMSVPDLDVSVVRAVLG